MNLLMAAAFFRNKRKKLAEQNKILKNKMIRCSKIDKDVELKKCLQCKYSKMVISKNEKFHCDYS